MLSSKKSVVVVGRRLRAYLGALLAVGFGAAWASFVPPPKVEASPNVAQVAPHVPENIGATRPLSSGTAARITPVKKAATRVAQTIVPKRRIAKRSHVERPFAVPPVPKKPPVLAVLTTLEKLPVVEVEALPVVTLPPAMELPPVPVIVDDPYLVRIPTRSS